MNHAIKTLENSLNNLKKTKEANTLIHQDLAKDVEERLAQVKQNEVDIQEIEAALIKLKENK